MRHLACGLAFLIPLTGTILRAEDPKPAAKAAAPKPPAPRPIDPGLQKKVQALIDAHKGKVALGIKDLKTGQAFLVKADEPMPTASLIKFPVMIEAYRQAAQSGLDLKKMVTVKKEDKVPGSGILTTHFSDGVSFPLRDAVRLMIVFSDNTATNLVLDQIGLKATAETMEKMGYPNTKVHSKVFKRETSVFPERSKEFGLGSTTVNEMLRLCEALEKRAVVSKEASEAMLDHMRACDDTDKFPRFLPNGTRIAFKTGSLDKVKTAAGILYTPNGTGPVALCVLTKDNEDARWVPDNAGNKLCADVAKAVYDHYAAGAPGPAKTKSK